MFFLYACGRSVCFWLRYLEGDLEEHSCGHSERSHAGSVALTEKTPVGLSFAMGPLQKVMESNRESAEGRARKTGSKIFKVMKCTLPLLLAVAFPLG